MTDVDKFQLNFIVSLAANLNSRHHVASFYNFSFSNCLNVIYSLFKVKDDILRVT